MLNPTDPDNLLSPSQVMETIDKKKLSLDKTLAFLSAVTCDLEETK